MTWPRSLLTRATSVAAPIQALSPRTGTAKRTAISVRAGWRPCVDQAAVSLWPRLLCADPLGGGPEDPRGRHSGTRVPAQPGRCAAAVRRAVSGYRSAGDRHSGEQVPVHLTDSLLLAILLDTVILSSEVTYHTWNSLPQLPPSRERGLLFCFPMRTETATMASTTGCQLMGYRLPAQRSTSSAITVSGP